MYDFTYPSRTAGENLYLFLRSWIRKGVSLNESFFWLSPIERSDEWSEYIEQFIAVALTGQVVAGGRTFRRRHGDSAPFVTEFRSYLNDALIIDRDDVNRLMRIATSAVDESMRGIADGLRRRFRRWAMANHPHCYLCDHSLDFGDQASDRAYTADHIWPQSYGGDSIEENLLPACRVCNDQHKSNFATWAMTSVQSVIFGVDPTAESLSRVTGTSRFAIHHRRVQQHSINARVSLKDAYRRIGPSEDLRTLNRNEVAHFFNLANHNDTIDAR